MTDIVDRLNDSLSAGYSELRKEAALEIECLRAKIEAMERQEPLDAGSDVFRSAFEAALKAGNWPATRQGDGYRSPSTQIAWRIAFSTVNRLKLYALPGAQPQLNEIKIALQRALELGRREAWTGVRKHRSWEDQREEQQCWNKVWSLLGEQGEEK